MSLSGAGMTKWRPVIMHKNSKIYDYLGKEFYSSLTYLSKETLRNNEKLLRVIRMKKVTMEEKIANLRDEMQEKMEKELKNKIMEMQKNDPFYFLAGDIDDDWMDFFLMFEGGIVHFAVEGKPDHITASETKELYQKMKNYYENEENNEN